MAEDAARELPDLPLEDALHLVHLYGECESPKYERAALRWLERYLVEGSPRRGSAHATRGGIPLVLESVGFAEECVADATAPAP